MKSILAILAAIALAVSAFAQAPAKPASAFDPVPTLPVTGSLQINYRTRAADKPQAGVTDVYVLNVNVANSAIFHGTIEQLPYIANTFGSDQVGRLTFDIDADVVNPRNVAQTRNVGKVVGVVAIDKANVYRFADGPGVKMIVFPIGAAKGFESRFNGLAYGKPPAVSGFTRSVQQAVRLVSSKGGTITLTKYDKMVLENHVLPSGPVAIYPETTVNGTLFYDYTRSAWHFNQVHFVYNAEGKRADDVLSGSIRWIEAKNRRQTGEGHYEVDVRLNEPPPTESAVFAGTQDEASFFQTDSALPGLTGAFNYKDTFNGASTDSVSSSLVQIDLKANQLSKAQAMALVKLLIFTTIVPFNAE